MTDFVTRDGGTQSELRGLFPLPPNEVVILADLYRLLDARNVAEGAGETVMSKAAAAGDSARVQPAPSVTPHPDQLFQLPARRDAA